MTTPIPVEVVPVNARLAIPVEAVAKLRQVYGVAQESRRVADLCLEMVCAGMGIDREHVVDLCLDTGELVLDEPDPDRMPGHADGTD